MSRDITNEVIERPFTLRKMTDGDLIPVLNIFRKIGMKEYKDVIASMAEGSTPEEIGMSMILEMASIVASNIPNAEKEIYDFCESISGIKAEEIKGMEFGTSALMIMDAFAEVKNTSFFKVVSKFLS